MQLLKLKFALLKNNGLEKLQDNNNYTFFKLKLKLMKTAVKNLQKNLSKSRNFSQNSIFLKSSIILKNLNFSPTTTLQNVE